MNISANKKNGTIQLVTQTAENSVKSTIVLPYYTMEEL